MPDTAAQIRSRVDAFVAEVTALVRQDALQQISDALGSVGVTPVRRGRGRPRKDGSGPPRFAVRAKAKGGKRTASDLAATVEAIAAYVNSNPGQGAGQIAKAIGVTPEDLKLPVRKLLADGVIRSKGQKRGTKYFSK